MVKGMHCTAAGSLCLHTPNGELADRLANESANYAHYVMTK